MAGELLSVGKQIEMGKRMGPRMSSYLGPSLSPEELRVQKELADRYAQARRHLGLPENEESDLAIAQDQVYLRRVPVTTLYK